VQIRGISGTELAMTADCVGCHETQGREWATSAHAMASFSNPIYRASFEQFRAARGKESVGFCGGCHDLALVADGDLAAAIEPADRRAHAGITCRVCHQADPMCPRQFGNTRVSQNQSPICAWRVTVPT
jgi:hypothetical protein